MSDAFNSDIKQALMILQEIKNSFIPTFSIYDAILSIIEKLISFDNDNELRVFTFEIFHYVIDINGRVPEETINMLLNIGAIFCYDIDLLKIIHHWIQKSKSCNETAMMNYIDNILKIKDNDLTLGCLDLLESVISSFKVLQNDTMVWLINMIDHKTKDRILKIIENVSPSRLENNELDNALWDLLNRDGCIETGLKVVTKHVMNGRSISDNLAETILLLLQSDTRYVDNIYDIFYNMTIGIETINPSMLDFCDFTKLIHDLNNQNTNSQKIINIIERLSNFIYEVSPIPTKFIKVLSECIIKANTHELISSTLFLLSSGLSKICSQSNQMTETSLESINWPKILKKVQHEKSHDGIINHLIDISWSKWYMFDDASLIEYSKRPDVEKVILNLRRIEKYRTILPNQWNLLVDLHSFWSQPITDIHVLKQFWIKIREYVACGYKISSILTK